MVFWLMPWADTRPIAGEYAYSTTNTWVAGVFPSWLHATYPSTPFAQSGLNSSISGWGTARYRAAATTYEGIRPDSTNKIISNDYLVSAGVSNPSGFSYTVFSGICPKRDLARDPIALDRCDGGVAVTLTGVTYRNTHSPRRHWQFELLLDGPLDERGNTTYPDTRRFWAKFLQQIERGVTWFSGAATGTAWRSYTPNSWASLIPYGSRYVGIPPIISGQVTDCTTTTFSPGAGDKMARFAATLTIAEVGAPGRV